MTYCPIFYPRLGGFLDFGLFRVGGSGLANSLYIWAKAVVLAERHCGQLVFPTWPQIKFGPLRRMESDRRLYANLFKPGPQDIDGWEKMALLLKATKITVGRIKDVINAEDVLYVVNTSALADFFEELIDDRDLIRRELIRRISRPIPVPDCPFIGIHVRLGDFGPPLAEPTPTGNQRLPLSWYIDRLGVVRGNLGWCAPAVIFSDGSAGDLAGILVEPNVTLRRGGNALEDLLLLSKAGAIIASASTFSYWAAYLGDQLMISRKGAWYTPFAKDDDRNWICTPSDTSMPDEAKRWLGVAGLQH